MFAATACEAMEKNRCLELRYDGFHRLVEVHAVGQTREGHWVVRAWQISGGSVSNEPVGWKLLRLDEAYAAMVTHHRSWAPREGYKPGDRAMGGGIRCQL
jgi:hypothetical protein